jgi:hypothetical protein
VKVLEKFPVFVFLAMSFFEMVQMRFSSVIGTWENCCPFWFEVLLEVSRAQQLERERHRHLDGFGVVNSRLPAFGKLRESHQGREALA